MQIDNARKHRINMHLVTAVCTVHFHDFSNTYSTPRTFAYNNTDKVSLWFLGRLDDIISGGAPQALLCGQFDYEGPEPVALLARGP